MIKKESPVILNKKYVFEKPNINEIDNISVNLSKILERKIFIHFKIQNTSLMKNLQKLEKIKKLI